MNEWPERNGDRLIASQPASSKHRKENSFVKSFDVFKRADKSDNDKRQQQRRRRQPLLRCVLAIRGAAAVDLLSALLFFLFYFSLIFLQSVEFFVCKLRVSVAKRASERALCSVVMNGSEWVMPSMFVCYCRWFLFIRFVRLAQFCVIFFSRNDVNAVSTRVCVCLWTVSERLRLVSNSINGHIRATFQCVRVPFICVFISRLVRFMTRIFPRTIDNAWLLLVRLI